MSWMEPLVTCRLVATATTPISLQLRLHVQLCRISLWSFLAPKLLPGRSPTIIWHFVAVQFTLFQFLLIRWRLLLLVPVTIAFIITTANVSRDLLLRCLLLMLVSLTASWFPLFKVSLAPCQASFSFVLFLIRRFPEFKNNDFFITGGPPTLNIPDGSGCSYFVNGMKTEQVWGLSKAVRWILCWSAWAWSLWPEKCWSFIMACY